MATKRTKASALIEEEPIIEAEYSPQDREIMAAVQSLEASGSGGSINIYRQGPGGYRDLAFLTEYKPAEFTLRQVQVDFGEGEYRVHIQNEGGGFVANKALKIGANKIGEIPRSQQKPIDLDKPLQNGTDMGALMGVMMTGFERLAASMKAAQPQIGLTEIVDMVAKLNGARPVAPDPLAMITQIVSLQKMLTPDRAAINPETGETDSGAIIMKALDTFGKPLADALTKLQGGAATAAPTPNPVPAPALPAPAVADAPALEKDETAMRAEMFLPLLIQMAATNADPLTYANLILDTFDDAMLAKYIDTPDWFEELSKLNPGVAQHRAWFEKVKAEITAALTELPEEVQAKGKSSADGSPNATGGNTP